MSVKVEKHPAVLLDSHTYVNFPDISTFKENLCQLFMTLYDLTFGFIQLVF